MKWLLSLMFFPALVFAQGGDVLPSPKVAEKEVVGTIKFANEKSPKAISLGLIPGDEPANLKKSGLALAKLLSQKLGVTVNLYISKDYQGMIDAMKAKKVDYAFFTAMSYVFAEKQAGAKVLLKKVWETPFYYSVILVKKGSKIKTLSDLKGKSFGFVDQKSTSGYLYPQVLFKKEGLVPSKDFKESKFFGNHESSSRALLDGKIDAIAVFSDSADGRKSAVAKFFAARQDEVEALWVGEPIPNDPFVVRQDFYEQYPQLTHRMMFAFIDLKEDEKGNLLKSLLGVSEVMMATSRQYDPVREMVKELNLKLDPQ